ncbi:MAG: ABC transporter permease [Deltaproteobacteria bacterium]|nr:ABC transporter permease [Deltaproteobacteria bacterium]
MNRLRDKIGRLRILLWREFVELRRDRFTLTIMALIPVFQITLLAYAITTDFDHLPLCVLDHAHTRESRQLLSDITATGYFTLTPLHNLEEVSALFGREHCRAALLIPTDFSELIANRKEVRLGLLLDASDTTLATSTEGFLTAMARAFYTHTRLERTPLTERNLRPEATGVVTTRRRVLFNPTLSGTAYTIPGLLGMICMFLTVLITALALVRERDTGTLEQLLVTPVTPAEVVLGKILPFGIVAMGAVVLSIILGRFIFGVSPAGSVLLLLAVTPIFLLIGLSLGLLISSLAHSAADALARSVLIMVPQLMLSDFIFPLSLMFAPFRVIGELIPLTHYLRITRGIYLKSQGLDELWPEVVILCVFLLLIVTGASRTIKKQG